MIKLLKKYQVQLTPFNATKKQALNNTDAGDNLLLTQDGYAIALQYIDYGDGSGLPVINSSCSIALNPMPYDLATVEQGLNITNSIVYPDSEPKNPDGTYKRSIYAQVKTMFYNNYKDPTKLWGEENVDFELSETKRHLTDQIQLIDVPRIVFGDKIVPNTINLHVDTSDNPYIIMDDGNGNLFAGINIFSHQQELGYFSNSFDAHSSSSYCDWYWGNNSEIEYDTSNVSVYFYSGKVENQLRTDTASLSVRFFAGSVVNAPPYSNTITNSISFYSASMQNVVTMVAVTGSLADIPTVNLAFNTGFITNTVTTVTSSFDSASTYLAFYTGSILLTTFPQTASFDSASTYLAFYTGSRILTTFPQTMSFNQVTTSIAFYQGSLM
jgi:hypothetical protein